MQKFQKYIERHHVDIASLTVSTLKADLTADIIVVIPCYDEPAILETLLSLRDAAVEHVNVEVIVVVNSGKSTPFPIVEQNRSTYTLLQKEAQLWRGNVALSTVLLENVRRKHAGVGYARKVGMDLAVARFLKDDNDQGVIASLDADTKVMPNYFKELYASFRNHPTRYGAILKFEHDLSGNAFSADIYDAIMHYELHLRYVNQALKMSGFPSVHHTVGSAFAVRASAYVAHGGMNRRQGGEDFYFLHKLFPHGEFVELNTTAVYPSPRPSHRVPFGTGPQVNVFLEHHELLTYSLDSFLMLKAFFANVAALYDANYDLNCASVMRDYLDAISFDDKVKEIRRNSASEKSFIKRFYAFFDAFKVVKFLNFSHQAHFAKHDVKLESACLLKHLNRVSDGGAYDLLMAYRDVEGK